MLRSQPQSVLWWHTVPEPVAGQPLTLMGLLLICPVLLSREAGLSRVPRAVVCLASSDPDSKARVSRGMVSSLLGGGNRQQQLGQSQSFRFEEAYRPLVLEGTL